MGDWIAFWNSEHSIYVNARHRDVHYRAIADNIMRYVPGPTATVMDYGCGEALHAGRIAAAAGRVILVDAADNVRAGLAERFKQVANIEVRAPDEIRRLDDRSVDVVMMNSVTQYLASPELSALFVLFRRLLKPGGLLVVGDVVPPDVSPIADVMALLNLAAANGFLIAALSGLVRTAFSDYRRVRTRVGLTLHSEADMMAKLAAAGFTAARAPVNIEPNPARMTFLARPG